MLFRKLTKEQKNNKIDIIILTYASIIALIVSGIILIFNAWYALGFIICFLASCLMFVKSNIIITKLLYQELFNPKKWMLLNQIINMIGYGGAVLLMVLIPTFNILCALGLIVIKIVTIILGIIYK